MSEPRETSGVACNSGNVNACVVCYRDVEIYSIGLCEHPVCYECSTRMRVLCQQNECPICRQDLPKVVFTRIVKPFRHLRRSNLVDTRYSIYFDSPDIQEKFNWLLAHACPICEEKQLFGNFNGLKDHMRRRHELHYCDLCVENLRIFSHERRCYTRSNLSQHRRKGDPDDRSHKGHPLCEFCDQRYMDNDELYRHLRRDHLYCHFCDADGLHHYYNSYNDLRDHFRNEHYLCEEAACSEEMFTGVFRTDIDLKAHKACTHGKHLGKAAAKQARTLELEFTLAPRGDNRNNRRIPGGSLASGTMSGNGSINSQSNSRRPRDYNPRDQQQQQQQQYQQQQQQQQQMGSSVREYQMETGDAGGFAQIPFDVVESAAFARQPDVRSTQEFPTLGNASSPALMPSLGQSRGRANVTICGSLKSKALAVTDENFPALDPGAPCSSTIAPKTLNLSVYSSSINNNKGGDSASSVASSQRPKSSATPNVSIHVNHKTDGTVTTRVSGPNIRIRPAQRNSMDCDFPALRRTNASGVATSTGSNSNTGQWTKVTCVKQQPTEQVSRAKKVAPSPFPEYPPRLPSSEDFPSLSKPASRGNKKQLTVTVVPESSSWSQQREQTSKERENENTRSVADATKGKTKKKKTKQSSGNNSSGNESTSSKSNNNNIAKTKGVVARKSGLEGEEIKSKDNGETDAARTTDDGRKENEKTSKKDKRKGGASADDSTSTTINTSEKQQRETRNNAEVVRKRSELKIDALNSNASRTIEEFPSLGSVAPQNHEAPINNGKFTAGKVTNPPPGFGSATPPPPGFAVKICNEADERTATKLNDSGLTFTNSSGEIYTILPTSEQQTNNRRIHAYAPPPDFQKRNKSLVARVTEALGDEEQSIQEFRRLSGSFRQGDCSAVDYYEGCRRAMGQGAFDNVFSEILVLLPDIDKQRELYEIHRREAKPKTSNNLEACTICGQILKIGADQRAHSLSHTMENHFPALGDASNLPSTTWVVRKV